MIGVSCPKCGTLNARGGYPAWVIIVAICFFPVGPLGCSRELWVYLDGVGGLVLLSG